LYVLKFHFCIYLRCSYEFCVWFCLYGIVHLLICLCWTIYASWNETNLLMVHE
jgi:hypothetical protein